jgi:hypothetical protein
MSACPPPKATGSLHRIKWRNGPIILQKSVSKGAFGAKVFWTEPS